ncbi:MAG: precorrin-6Y C5,15-methyltransferase (decarboxylating) subunit CbiT [Candidatus Bathyarchaeota archaeon]|nr:precorrin-6Y C5,15-methyltransferase (decarboxylating) subunit CbiT [Candidatus Bathyarchaeota archaeon]
MWKYRTPGIPDENFNQNSNVPGPTKEEIRVLTLAKARLCSGSLVVDVGCGTGGLTVEAALQVAPTGKVFALDENEAAIELTKSNLAKFGVQNTVQLIHGKAPQALDNLPEVDAFLIGGSRLLRDVIRVAHKKLVSQGRIVVNAILLETAVVAIDELRRLPFKEVDVTQVLVAKGTSVSSGVMMLARNPITIISATKENR